MNYSYITEPLIGALIGYSTNWIAIKMMFRPREEVKIGKITMPFTPGIVPKNRKNIAKAISMVITNNLLTEEDLKKSMLSDEIKDEIKNMVNTAINNNENTLKELVVNNLGEKTCEEVYNIIVDKISKSAYNTIKEKNIGEIIENKIYIVVEQKMSGTILGFLGGNKIAQPIIENIIEQIEDYINSDGEKVIKEMVSTEMNKYMSIKIAEMGKFNIEEIAVKIYEKIISSKISDFLKNIDLLGMIENKINSMKIEELEKIILSVMKKELNAIVNLGAVIGFVLGLFNLLF